MGNSSPELRQYQEAMWEGYLEDVADAEASGTRRPYCPMHSKTYVMMSPAGKLLWHQDMERLKRARKKGLSADEMRRALDEVALVYFELVSLDNYKRRKALHEKKGWPVWKRCEMLLSLIHI